jgi:Raf kinase inhibitor-like YbhB/YbcL family protein
VLEHVPQWIGEMLKNVRAGHSKLVVAQDDIHTSGVRIDISSPAFASGARLPERFTADGVGLSPPLVWGQAPEGTSSFALIVEDPDAPATSPLVHAIVWNIPATEVRLAEGAIAPDDDVDLDGSHVGRNSFLGEGWLPPDPPTGHGSHDYVFQLFALSQTPDVGPNPGRSDFVKAIRGNVLAAGILVGTYSRGEDAVIGFTAISPAII